MKSDVIAVSSRNDQTERILQQTERVADYCGLSGKSALHLRLLAEEMMSMMRAIDGDTAGEFWIEAEAGQFALHLQVKTNMDAEAREKLLSASSSGKNEADRGFMGKLRAFFEPVDGLPLYFDMNPDGIYSDAAWTMRSYQLALEQRLAQNLHGAHEAWDELEKSVIAHVADDIKISIRGRDVEMTVLKQLA